MNDKLQLPEYGNWLKNLKHQIKNSQIKAVLAVNSELILLYWDLGRQIVEKQENAKWGSGFIRQLSEDLRAEFPDISGFSFSNLHYCRRFYKLYSSQNTDVSIRPHVEGESQVAQNEIDIIFPQVVGKLESDIYSFPLIPWGHHRIIIDKCDSVKEALFYINKTIENNWSRSVLEYQIETNLYERQGKAITNFSTTLPKIQSDLANELLKDPYNFDFLQLSEKVRETDLEKSLVAHISQFLLELGKGFAYMGRQFLLKIGNKEYRTDLLFYHTKLKCYIIIELKMKEFEPEFVGKLNYYISAINELVKEPEDQPTIGILLCKNKDDYEVEFALKDINKPIGVSAFRYTELSDEIRNALPSDEELEQELKKFEQQNERKEI
ncbi:MAG: PDDEXK nuclease domain-containing protein [Bergeyella sp.]